MPTYVTPPDTPITPSFPSSRSSSFHAPSRWKSTSSYSGRKPPQRHHSDDGHDDDHHSDDHHSKDEDEKKHHPHTKGGLLFLGTIAAAAFAAHKYWPKGFLYGEPNHWEVDHHHHDHGKEAKRTLHEEKISARRSDRSGATSSTTSSSREYTSGYADREERRARYREAASGRPPVNYVTREEVLSESSDWSADGSRGRMDPRSRRSSFVSSSTSTRRRSPSQDQYDDYDDMVGRPRTRRGSMSTPASTPPSSVSSYYPPAPQRSGSSGAPLSRYSGSSSRQEPPTSRGSVPTHPPPQRTSSYYNDEEVVVEPVYVYSDLPARSSRRSSVDAPRRKYVYEDEYSYR
ncbi:hypothetical protein B0H63DRAFT_256505 [Podospora didyma]|uniref:Uncharacterized protein n=1 Tax=Podospora didyma TaxID=330526 RepID=A0AAE0N8J7_9PEZI|nr:hypothetical protein B0H63DRAFT_256505 [Podospora didyma]